jgi:hypothetical protein
VGDNIKMVLRLMGWVGMDGIDLPVDMDPWRAQENAVMDLQV